MEQLSLKDQIVLVLSRNTASVTHRVEVRQEVPRHTTTGLKLRDDTKRRQRSEVLVVLVRPLQLLLSCTDAKVVQDDVAFCVAELERLLWLLLRIGDDFWILGVCVRVFGF